MKTFNKGLALTLALTMTGCTAGYQASTQSYPIPSDQQDATVSYAQQEDVSVQLFYDQLSPYGTWVSYPNYGYVWIPNVGREFQPYSTSGHWVFTDMGWTWYSTYSWGWAPFHYGRWFYDNTYGWMWLPDTDWGPAWVTWRSGGDYYGWAPMEPGITITVAFGGTYQPPANRWIFVRNRDLDQINISSYSINQTNNTTIINNTIVVQNSRQDRQRNVTFVAGPDRGDVEQLKGSPVKQVVIQENNRPGQKVNNREMKIYKPRVQQEQGARRKSAPMRTEEIKKVKPVMERNNTNPQRNMRQDQRTNQNKQQPNNLEKKKPSEKKKPRRN